MDRLNLFLFVICVIIFVALGESLDLKVSLDSRTETMTSLKLKNFSLDFTTEESYLHSSLK